MTNLICLDFDDTVVVQNVCRAMFERFASPGWRDFEGSYRAGNLTVEQYNQASIALIQASTEEVLEFVRSIVTPRAGLLELVSWADWHEWQVVVVSNGFDLYVDAVLDDLGLDRVVRHAGRARQEYRWRVRYFSPRGIELQAGFKLSYAASFQAAGDFVAYIGDGASDVDAARLAQAVFARDALWERLRGRHDRVYPFETFHDAMAVLDREASSWLESFSSTTAGAD